MNGRLTITELAGKIGVTTKTLIRWEKAGKIRNPKRDWRGWRVYTEDDLQRLEQKLNQLY
jgi:DNA-binding transcriptional MerR regulator